MENDSTFGMSYTSESPLWEQWLSANQRVPLCSSEDNSSTENSVYTQTGPLFDGFLFHSNTGLTGRWHDISHVADYTNPWNGLNHVIEHTPPISVSEHRVSEEASPVQGHWHSSSTLRNPNPKQDCYPDNLPSRKSTSRTPLGDRDINAQAKKTTRHSTVHRTRHVSGNGVHPAQRGNSRVKRIQEQNRIASNKLRAKQREEQLRLESRSRTWSVFTAIYPPAWPTCHSRYMSLRCNFYSTRNAIAPSSRTTSSMSPADMCRHSTRSRSEPNVGGSSAGCDHSKDENGLNRG